MVKKGYYDSDRIIHCVDTGENVKLRDYLNSKHWLSLRDNIFKKYNGECQRCGDQLPSSMMNVHHKTYKRIGKEVDQDLILYCNRCHKIIHKSKITNDCKDTLKELHRLVNSLDKYQRILAIELLKNRFDIENDVAEQLTFEEGSDEYIVYTVLHSFLSGNGRQCSPSLITIRNKSNIDGKCTHKALKNLEKMGYIKIKSGVRKLGKNVPNVYTILK